MFFGNGIARAEEFEISVIEHLVQRYGDHPYHNVGHTIWVRQAACILADILHRHNLITLREAFIVETGALTHDWAQDGIWSEAPNGAGTVFRPSTALNEAKSTREGLLQLQGFDIQLSSEEKRLFCLTHQATIARFDPATQTVVQPALRRETPHPVQLCVGLADLSSVGMNWPLFLEEGDWLIREGRCFTLDELAPALRRQLWTELQDWNKSQVNYAEGRQKELKRVIAHLTLPVRKAIMEAFGDFDRSISEARARAERRSQLSLEALLRDMGFSP